MAMTRASGVALLWRRRNMNLVLGAARSEEMEQHPEAAEDEQVETRNGLELERFMLDLRADSQTERSPQHAGAGAARGAGDLPGRD